jgi:hypothetical protein
MEWANGDTKWQLGSWFVHHTHANVEMFINPNYLHMIKWPPTNKNTTPHNDAAVMLDFPLAKQLLALQRRSQTMDPVQKKTNTCMRPTWGITSGNQTWQWEIIHGRVNGKSICKWALLVDCHWLPCLISRGYLIFTPSTMKEACKSPIV